MVWGGHLFVESLHISRSARSIADVCSTLLILAFEDPVPTFLKPGIDLTLNYGALRPAAPKEVLSTRRVLCLPRILRHV